MAVLRTLRPGDLPSLRALLLGLSRHDRALRFNSAMSDAGIETHCRAIAQAGSGTRVLGAFEGGRLIGAAELWFDAGLPPHACEVAFEVDASWRGRGLGTELLRRAVLVARNRWTRRLHFSCLIENRRMQGVARRVSGDLRFEDGSAEAEVLLPRPSWHSLWAEAIMDAQGFAAAPVPGGWGPDAAWRNCLGRRALPLPRTA